MYYQAVRRLNLASGECIERNEKVPDTVHEYIKVRFEKMGLMRRVYDTVQEEKEQPVYEKTKSEREQEMINAYKNGEGGIKKLADRYNLTQYSITKILKKKKLL